MLLAAQQGRDLRGQRRPALGGQRGARRGGGVPPGRRDRVGRGQGRGQRPQRPLARRRLLARIAALRVSPLRPTSSSPWAPGWRWSPSTRPAHRPHRRRRGRDRPQPPEHDRARRRRPRHPGGPPRAAPRRRPAAAVAEGRARGDPRRCRRHLHPGAPGVDPQVAARGHPGGRDLRRRHDPDRLLLAARTGRCTTRGPTSRRRTRATSATRTRSPSAPRSRGPTAPVVSVSGDGGFMYNAQELATAVRHGINVVAVVFNDNAYGNVGRDLDESWGGEYGAKLHNPDFMKLADAFGVYGMRAKDPLEVGQLVKRGIEMDRPGAHRGARGPHVPPGVLAAAEEPHQVPARVENPLLPPLPSRERAGVRVAGRATVGAAPHPTLSLEGRGLAPCATRAAGCRPRRAGGRRTARGSA